MKFNEYQEAAKATAVYPAELALLYVTLGMAGEAGEVANAIKKVIRDGGGEVDWVRKGKIAKEIGDVLWYVASLCTELGLDLDAVAQDNIQKLRERAERGTIRGEGDDR